MVLALAAGTQCFVPDEKQIWLAAEVISHDATSQILKVRIDSEERDIDLNNPTIIAALKQNAGEDQVTIPLQNPTTQATEESGVEDMVNLNYLHEPAILFNLKHRFLKQNPYTYTGGITIAVNPYQWLPDLYTEDVRQKYLENDRGVLPPHVYATSIAAYKHMTKNGMNQSILVSGESGAGKTETTKIVMRHLASISGGEEQVTIKRIIEMNPLLESFGNAKTVRNDNSSRFGKFLQLQFDANQQLIGAQSQTYLLETTRVIHHTDQERNYHIFYQLLASSAEERKELCLLTDASEYTYLGKGTLETKIDGLTDAEHLERTKHALALIGLTPETQKTLFRSLAGILLLGQVQFENDANNDEACHIVLSKAIQDLVALFGLNEEALTKALCSRTVKAGTDVCSVPLTSAHAIDSRDALAKAFYSKLFSWLVETMNKSMSADTQAKMNIGILDIFGFEHFEHNSFEQFCINYANEKLQQKFTADVFKSVQVEYEEEGISWKHIEFQDNQNVLHLIESSMGLISILNEELIRPKGNDIGFVNKAASVHREDNKDIIQFPKRSKTQFTIQHYAAPVSYEAEGFLEKHKDTLFPDLDALMQSSSIDFIRERFMQVQEQQQQDKNSRRRKKPAKSTVGSKFKKSLGELMETIQATNVHYVRCIKPNSKKSPSELEHEMVIKQLRCAGVIEAIRISRTAYPNRLLHEEFVNRFHLFLLPELKEQHIAMKEAAKAIVEAKGLEQLTHYQIGLTKIYFRYGELEKLDELKLHAFSKYARVVQTIAMGFLERRKYQRTRACIITIQAVLRSRIAFLKYQICRRGITRLQARYRGQVGRVYAKHAKKDAKAIMIQSLYRGYAVRRGCGKHNAAASKIQSLFRMNAQRNSYRRLVAESKNDEVVSKKLKELEERLVNPPMSSDGKTPESGSSDTSFLKNLQAENKSLRKELKKEKSEHVETKNKAHKYKNAHEVSVASSQLKVKQLQATIKQQKDEMENTRKEYELLRDYIAKNMPDADLDFISKPKKASRFAYFRNFAGSKQPTEDVTAPRQSTATAAARMLKTGAGRMKFWGSRAPAKPVSITAEANIDGETVDLDNLPSNRRSYIGRPARTA